VSALTLWQYK